MAKGFNNRGLGGMGGGNMNNMIRQAQKMQQDMLKAQEELEAKPMRQGRAAAWSPPRCPGKRSW